MWLLTGAFIAVAVTVVGAATWSANAAPGDVDTTYVPTPGCRLVDTRPGETNNIGERDTPLGPGDTHTVQVRGDNGQCVGALAIPDEATGVALNVTAVGATAASNIRVYPADLTEPPLLSNLNVTAGGPATPNKVDVRLSSDGAITVYNFKGQVHVVLDVVGYYTAGSLTEIDRRLREVEATQGPDADLVARIERMEGAIADNAAAVDSSLPFVETSWVLSAGELTTTPKQVATVPVTAPSDGHVTVAYSASVVHDNGGRVRCQAELASHQWPDADILPGPGWVGWSVSGNSGSDDGTIASTRRFEIAAGDTVDYVLWCEELPDGGRVGSITLTAIFTPLP